MNKTVIKNTVYLFFLQGSNYILPIITFPYLIRVLGFEKFGLIMFAQAFSQYFIIVTDYGFNLSGTRKISVNRKNSKKVNEIFSSIITIKLILLLICFLIMVIVISFFDKFRNDYIVFFISFGMVIGHCLFPVWLFQGLEKMKYVTFFNILTKSFFTGMIFIFIKNSSQYVHVAVFNSTAFLITGIVSLFFALKFMGVKFIIPSFSRVIHEMKEGFFIFISLVFINIFTVSNTFFLGLFSSNSMVGIFSSADKIIRALTSLFNPFFQAYYPHIALNKNRNSVIKLLKIGSAIFVLSLFVFLLLNLFPDTIVKVIAGEVNNDIVMVLKILSPLVIIIPIAYICANLILIPFNFDRIISNIYFSGSLINLFFIFGFVWFMNLEARGAALSNLLTETIITFIMIVMIFKYKNRILKDE